MAHLMAGPNPIFAMLVQLHLDGDNVSNRMSGYLNQYSDLLRAGRFGDRVPGVGWGGELFRTCPDRSSSLPSLLYNGYRVFPGGKAAEAWR